MRIDQVAPFLLHQGLIDSQSILWRDLKIVSAARRNQNFLVQQESTSGYLIKQPADAVGGSFESLRTEANFYKVCSEFDSLSEIRAFIAPCLFFDATSSLIVLKLIENARSLWDYYHDFSPDSIPTRLNSQIGHCLGLLHGGFSNFFSEHPEYFGSVRKDPPWVFTVHKPSPEMLALVSPANYEMVRRLQEDLAAFKHFDALLSLWSSRTLIHGDIKSDNILVRHIDQASAYESSMFLVDWELVQFGDPAWDIACMLQDLVLFWINTLPPRLTLEDSVNSGPYRLAVIHDACRAFWQGYEQSANLTELDNRALLRKTVLFTAARLVLAAYEMCAYENRMPSTAMLLVQLALSIFSSPETAQVQIFGIYETH
jgi:hypothetical protein